MSGPSLTGTLYNCAVECALQRRSRSCKESFGSTACNGCKWNILEYTDVDIRQAKLFMLSAEDRAGDIKAASKLHRVPLLMIIIIFTFFGIKNYRIEKWLEAKNLAEATPKTSVVTDSVHQNITSTLYKVHQKTKEKKIDVNGDGLVNCIDAAVLFYKYYPNKNDVCIELNVNNATKLNHLFNCVRVNGAWRAVEPQGYGSKSYWMRDIWGDAYNSKLNQDVTEKYKRYVR